MYDHVSVGVTDFQRSLKFYDAVMQVLGHERAPLGNEAEGFMVYGRLPYFVINTPVEPQRGAVQPSNGAHVCFQAETPAKVDAFYQEAIRQGATSAGEPGLRPQYEPGYYAAFVYDPDGHKIEAVTYV